MNSSAFSAMIWGGYWFSFLTKSFMHPGLHETSWWEQWMPSVSTAEHTSCFKKILTDPFQLSLVLLIRENVQITQNKKLWINKVKNAFQLLHLKNRNLDLAFGKRNCQMAMTFRLEMTVHVWIWGWWGLNLIGDEVSVWIFVTLSQV